MARIRSVHPSLFTDEAWVSCSPLARILYIGLWTDADDQGLFEWKPLQIKMRLLPGDMAEAGPLLDELSGVGLISSFDAAGKTFGAIRDFRKFQRPQKPNAIHPLPDFIREYVGLSLTIPVLVDDRSDTDPVIPPQMEDGGYKIVEEAADTAREISVDDWPAGKSIDHARMLCDAVSNAGTLDTAREPGLIQTLGLLHRWRTRGAMWEADVLPVVMAVCGKRAGNGPIKTWAYFDQAVAEATKARLAPVNEETTDATDGNANHGGRTSRQSDIDAMLEGARQAVDRRHAELSGCG